MREVTVGDNWTGNSRLKPEVQKAVVDMTTLVLGRNAFKYLVTAEKGWQAAVSVAKNTIVIRSIIVPASNMASNVLQLMTNGVGLRDITKGMPEKLVEIDQHLKNVQRIVELKAELAHVDPNSVPARKIKASPAIKCSLYSFAFLGTAICRLSGQSRRCSPSPLSSQMRYCNSRCHSFIAARIQSIGFQKIGDNNGQKDRP